MLVGEVAFLSKLSDENRDGSPDEMAKSMKSSHLDEGSKMGKHNCTVNECLCETSQEFCGILGVPTRRHQIWILPDNRIDKI